MLRSIVASSLKYRFIIVAAATAMLIFGILQLPHAPMDAFPEFAPPRVEIQTPCFGLAAEEVEGLVTVPLEQALNGVDGLEVMRSYSLPDLSSITLFFKLGTDEVTIRQLVQERVSTVIPTLPTWAAPPILMPTTSTTARVMKIGISSKTLSTIDLSMIGYWKIRARLLRVPGVANIPMWGEKIRIPQVRVDPDQMREHGVSIEDVMETTADALDVGILKFSDGAIIGTGGWIETPNQRLGIHHVLPITSHKELAQVPIGEKKKSNGTPLTLNDVASVIEDTWPLFGDAVINGGEGLLLIVERFPWANTLEVTRGVEEALKEMKPGLKDIDIDPTIFRPADYIQSSLDNLNEALLIGCLLVMLVLAVFLFEWRTALISMLAIPLSLMAGAFVLYLRGASINTMILAGFVIAVGVVVDDAIIDVENIVRRLRQHRKEGSTKSTARIILDASLEVRQAIIHATVIDAMVLLPIFFMGGLSGAFFQPLALSYALAVLASMLVALTVTPALCMILLTRAHIEDRKQPLIHWLQGLYDRVLTPIIRKPIYIFITTAVIMVIGLSVLPLLGESLFPNFRERDFLMHWITKPGTSIGEERRIVTRASNDIQAIPGVRNFGCHIGQALLADEICGVNFGEIWVSIDPSVDYDKTVASIQEVADSYPGLFRNVLTYLNESIDEVLTGSKSTFAVRIYGPDLNVIHNIAQEIKGSLEDINGVEDLFVELQAEVPQVQVQVDLAAARHYGIKPGDVRRMSATLLAGEEVGDLYRNGKAYDVNVWSKPIFRTSLTDLKKLPIDIPGGGHVPMEELAAVRIRPSQNVIERENDSRRIDVDGEVPKGHDLGAVMRAVEDRVEKIKFPLGYHAEILGEYAERQEAQNRLMLYSVIAAIGVFLVLLASFGNGRLAILSFLALPTALVGGLLAAFATSGIITLGSLVGFLTVFGIVARNGIMMINHFQHLEEQEGEKFGPRLVLRGARERLAPILMTACTTGLALVPMVVAGNVPGHEIEYPMAIVIMGGLVTSTLLNLFVVPSLYLKFGRSKSNTERVQTA